MAMAAKTNKFLLLFCSICLFIPLALSAVQNTSILDSLMISGKENYERGRSDHAIFILLRAQELAENLQDIDKIISINKLLAEIYENQEDYKSANIYLKKIQTIQDGLSLLQLEQIHYYEQDETRPLKHQTYIERLELAKRNQLILFVIIISALLLILFILIFLKSKHSEKRMQLVIDEQTKDLKETNLKLEHEIKEKAESEEKFRTIYENAPVMINAFDENGKCLLWNKECENQLGWSKEELNNSENPLSLIYPNIKDKDQVLKWIKIADGKFNENIATAKDGSIKIQMWSNYRLAPSFCLCVGYDITDQKKSENDLKESKERYKQLINNSPSLILEIDSETYEIISCNPAMAKSLNSTIKDVVGKNIRELLPKDIFMRRLEIVRKALAENKTFTFEDSNHGRFFFNTGIPIITADRKTLQIVSYDITDRKKTEIALKESEALLKSLIYNIPLEFYARDKDRKVFMQSSRSIGKWGDLYGTTVDYYSIDNSIKKLWNKWLNSAYAGQDVEGEYDIYINDELHHMKTILAPIKRDNEIIGVLGTDIDITEMKESENKLLIMKDDLENMVEAEIEKRKAQQELLIQKSKLESLGQLAAGIAHEINQPIGLIALGMDNISERLKSGSDVSATYLNEKIDKFFKYIERIRQIIDHISTFSRDQKDITFDEVDINIIIDQALTMIKLQYEAHDIHFETHLEENLPMILGNSFKIEQVLLNLLSNSHDALEAKTNTHVDFQKTITIKTCKKGKYIIIEFTDNGIGMSPRELESIFDPFYTTKESGAGTGLGLSISYGILEDMKADISVKSVPGEFTTFTIKFQSC